MGDFNDTPDNEAFSIMSSMDNLALPLYARGEGTIRYSGKWEMIDMFFVPKEAAVPSESRAMEVLHVPFLTVRDNTHSGEKPLRTYSGPRYLGGVSDHCPILLVIQ